MMLALGLAVAALAWLGPLPSMTDESFTAHMVLHLAIMAVAAPLIAGGLTKARLPWLTQLPPRLFAALPAAFFEWIVAWAWHVPGLHHAAHVGRVAFGLEQATFAFAGLWLWLSALSGSAQPARAGAGVLAFVLTFAHMTMLGAIIALAPRPLYGGRAHPAVVDVLRDQEMGGILMIVVSGFSCLAGVLVLGRRLLASPAQTLETA